MPIRLLADMNISPKTVEALQRQGWDVIRVSHVMSSEAPDDRILSLAREERRVVITQDLDFSALLALGGYQEPSLVTSRLIVSDPETVTRRLLDVLPGLEDVLQKGSAVTVDDFRVRVRSLPIV